jgi:hypothetical protein
MSGEAWRIVVVGGPKGRKRLWGVRAAGNVDAPTGFLFFSVEQITPPTPRTRPGRFSHQVLRPPQ